MRLKPHAGRGRQVSARLAPLPGLRWLRFQPSVKPHPIDAFPHNATFWLVAE